MSNFLMNGNSFESGIVTHVSGHKPDDGGTDNGKDYGVKIIVALMDSSLFVVKYSPEYIREVKSVKFWVNIHIDTYLEHNTKIEPVEEGWGNLNLPKFLEKLISDPIYGPRFIDDIHNDNMLNTTMNFFSTIEEDLQKIAFDSFYVSTSGVSEDGTEARRLAFKSDAYTSEDDINVVIKLWDGVPVEEAKMSIKFDDTPIPVMAAQWNMEKRKLDKHGTEFIASLGDKVAIIGSKEAKNVNNSNYDSNVKIKRKDLIFNFPDVDLEFYIVGFRAVIVFQMTLSDTYALWDVTGGEDHRLTISAKGPFDSTLNVTPEETWDVCSYDQNTFLANISISKEDIVKTFSRYSFKWMLNAQELSITSSFKKGIK